MQPFLQLDRVGLRFWHQIQGRWLPLVAVLLSVLLAFVVTEVSAGVALGIVVGAILAVVGMASYEVLVHAMIVLLPLQSSLPVSFQSLGVINPFNTLAGVLFALWLVNSLLARERLLNWSWMNLVVAAFVLVCIAALFNSGRSLGADFMDEQVNPLKRWLSPMLLFFPISNGRFKRPAIKRMVFTVLIMCAVVALWTLKDLYNLGWDEINEEARIGGPFGLGGENDIAGFFVYYPIIALTIALFENRFHRRVALLGIFLIGMAPLLLLLSRGAYLGIIAVLLFAGAMRFRWLLVLTVFAVLFYKSWTPGVVQERWESTQVASNDMVGGRVPAPYEQERRLEASSALRVRIWRGAWRMIESHPFTGVGYNVFPAAIPEYANMERNMDAHNMFLRVTAEMGVGGLVFFFLLLAVPFYSMLRVYNTTGDRFMKGWMLGGMAAICGILVVNFFGSRFVREELVGLYWILVALTYSYVYLRRDHLRRRKMCLVFQPDCPRA